MRGRKASGPEFVEQLSASAKARERGRVILQTVAQQLTVKEACRRLGIGEALFGRLRRRLFTGGLPALEDRPAGRRRRSPAPAQERLEQLQAELQQTRLDAQAAQLREEIALTMPHLLQPPAPEKKTRRRRT